jgi:hypothetical protein
MTESDPATGFTQGDGTARTHAGLFDATEVTGDRHSNPWPLGEGRLREASKCPLRIPRV